MHNSSKSAAVSEAAGMNVCEVSETNTREAGSHLAAQALAALRACKATLAVAESLTGGALAAEIVSVPGASQVFRGGAVTYATDTKAEVLGVSAERLAQAGPVDSCVAEQMARGAAQLFRADYALATTGVAGPGSADGIEAGTVFVSVFTPPGSYTRQLTLRGNRGDVRAGTVEAALRFLIEFTENTQVETGR